MKDLMRRESLIRFWKWETGKWVVTELVDMRNATISKYLQGRKQIGATDL